ncbi:MAG TPA: hypothetical protein VF941_01015 [Clostridia bacterium]
MYRIDNNYSHHFGGYNYYIERKLMQSKSYLIIVVLCILYFLGKRIFEYFENRNLQSFDKDNLEMKALVENTQIEAEKIL